MVHPDGTSSNRRATGVSGPRNAVNPRVGSGMQQAHGRSYGGTRRGGARPRGRNETSWRGSHGAEGRRESSGSGRTDGMSTEGRSESQERRRRTGRRSGVERSSKGRRKANGARGGLFGARRRSQPGVLGVRAERPTDAEGGSRRAKRATDGGDWTRNGKPTLDAAQRPSQPHGGRRLGNRLPNHPVLPEPL